MKCFSLDIEANKAAVLASLNRNTLNRHYMLIRKCIAEYCEMESCSLGNVCNTELKIDDADEGDDCCIASNASTVFGICLRNGRIFTEVIPENDLPMDGRLFSSRQEYDFFLQSCPRGRWHEYQAVVDYENGRYLRTSQDNDNSESIRDLKSCDLFWGFVKGRLMKFNGISKSTLYFHLKECEFRFNHRNENLYKLLLKIIRQNPLN